MTTIRVNIRTQVNKKSIRKERRNGRDVIIVPSATLPDDVVMNGILYPADEIEKSYKSLDQTPAPLGHPNINGEFVSASHPEGMVRGFVGAWNENVRRENGRVLLDKVIDIEFASQTNGGKAVLDAIDKGEPVHTSTGLYGIREEIANADKDGPQYVMKEIIFDHDAILLGEDGAATPDQGVGMMVNAKSPKGDKVEVVNSALDRAETELDYAGTYLLEAIERVQKASKWEQMKASLLSLLSGKSTNNDEGDGAMNDAQFKEMQDKLGEVTDSVKALTDGITNAITNALKPVVDGLTAIQNKDKAAEEAKKATLVKGIVEGGLLTEAVANTLSLEALEDLSKAQGQKHTSPHLNTRLGTVGGAKTYQLPKSEG